MRLQINSDKNVVVDAELAGHIKGEVHRVLKRFTPQLTRVEVHLSDVNSHKPGALDKRCMAEARPARYRPLTATSRAAKIEGAVRGALTKLQSSLETLFGRLETRRATGARALAPRRQATAKAGRLRAKKTSASRRTKTGQADRAAAGSRSRSSTRPKELAAKHH